MILCDTSTEFHLNYKFIIIKIIIHSSNPPVPPFTKGGGLTSSNLKFGNKGGDKIFFLERGGLLRKGRDSSLLNKFFVKRNKVVKF